MKIEQVKKMKPLDRLLYWVKTREEIRLKKEAGEDKPWTNDKIFQTTYFTCVNRENDKVTVWLRENIREPLRDDPRVFFAVLAFRWFNYIPTGVILRMYDVAPKDKTAEGYFTHWDLDKVVQVLTHLKDSGNKVFTGAFNISNSGSTKPKINRVCEDYIQPVWEQRKTITDHLTYCQDGQCLADAHALLMQMCPGLGGSGFMAAQVIADLKHTYLLEDATDWWTWCSPGPGSKRGMNRVLGRDPKTPISKPRWVQTIEELREEIYKSWGAELDAQCIQSCLCEISKYESVLWGEGRSKRTYPGSK